MCKWYIDPAFETSTGQPKRWFDDHGEVFALGAIRLDGGDDATMPRRVLARGGTREQTSQTLARILSAYDSSWTVVNAP
jgi:hypothetical protein